MDFGIHLPDAGRDPSREAMLTYARTAEELGYASVWASDHIAWPDPATLESKYPYADDNSGFPAANSPWLDCIGSLTFAAAVTDRVQLGTTVLILGYRPVVQQAKAWATLDHLSGGRAILGVGVGWMREEFEAIGMPWDERGARADEMLEVFEVLWRDDLASFDGPYTSFRDIGFAPKPPRGRIPVWVGGHTRPALRRAARHGDAFHAAFASPAVLAAQRDGLRAECEAIGRDPSDVPLTALFRLSYGGGDVDDGQVGGSSEEILDQLGTCAELGVEHVCFFVLGRGHDGRIETIHRFAEEVMAKL